MEYVVQTLKELGVLDANGEIAPEYSGVLVKVENATKKFVSPMDGFVPGRITHEERIEILNYYVDEYEKRNGMFSLI